MKLDETNKKYIEYDEDFDAFLNISSKTNYVLKKEHYKRITHQIAYNRKRNFLKFTTIIVCIFGFASIFIYFKYKQSNQFWIAETGNETKTMALSDGSKVILSKYSSIKIVPNEFNKTQRLVLLTGTATFKVTKNTSKPFIVQSKYTQVKALGTRFKVSEIDSKQTMVFLYEGKISVNGNTKSLTSIAHKTKTKDLNLILTPKQGIIINDQKIILSSYVNTVDLVKLTNKAVLNTIRKNKIKLNNTFCYSNITLSKVINDLSAYHQIEILYPKEITDKIGFTGNLNSKYTIEKSLKIITKMNDLTLTKNKNYYIIEKSCEQ